VVSASAAFFRPGGGGGGGARTLRTHLERDRLAREGLDEDLHGCSQLLAATCVCFLWGGAAFGETNGERTREDGGFCTLWRATSSLSIGDGLALGCDTTHADR
jgi:hypothetical protein